MVIKEQKHLKTPLDSLDNGDLTLVNVKQIESNAGIRAEIGGRQKRGSGNSS